jgi:cell division protein FtsL
VSTPARRLDAPTTAPSERRVPTPTPRARPARPRTSPSPRPVRRARRGLHPAFWACASVLITAMVVGVVSLSALVVQTGFRIDRTEERIAELADRQEILTKDAAEMASPVRIARWARLRGLVMPDDVVVLRVPAGGGA